MEKSSAVTTAFLLGAGGGTCLSLSMSPSVSPFAIYVVLLVTFHVSEYVLAGAYRPDTASHDSFLLQHSRAYQLMVLVCWLEYWLEWFGGAQPWPGWKEWGAVPSVGLVVCSAGLLARAVGIATASSNFSHQIEEQKRDGHRLVTHGIYSFLRHPAYFGFFWWSAGSQILLVNPICLTAYVSASWLFFFDRIPDEEELLVGFFGGAWKRHAHATWVGIPLLGWVARRSDGAL